MAGPSLSVNSVRKAIRMEGCHIGQRCVSWGFQDDRGGTEFLSRVVSDGNGRI